MYNVPQAKAEAAHNTVMLYWLYEWQVQKHTFLLHTYIIWCSKSFLIRLLFLVKWNRIILLIVQHSGNWWHLKRILTTIDAINWIQRNSTHSTQCLPSHPLTSPSFLPSPHRYDSIGHYTKGKTGLSCSRHLCGNVCHDQCCETTARAASEHSQFACVKHAPIILEEYL